MTGVVWLVANWPASDKIQSPGIYGIISFLASRKGVRSGRGRRRRLPISFPQNVSSSAIVAAGLLRNATLWEQDYNTLLIDTSIRDYPISDVVGRRDRTHLIKDRYTLPAHFTLEIFVSATKPVNAVIRRLFLIIFTIVQQPRPIVVYRDQWDGVFRCCIMYCTSHSCVESSGDWVETYTFDCSFDRYQMAYLFRAVCNDRNARLTTVKCVLISVRSSLLIFQVMA